MPSYREVLSPEFVRQAEVAGVPKMRRFYLMRLEDESGVSGTGVVAVGVVLPSGRCVQEWVVEGKPRSMNQYDSIQDLIAVHGHEGKTEVRFLDA